VQQADARIADLQRQFDAAQAQLAGKDNPDTVAQKLYGYAGLTAADTYAQQALIGALQNYDTARVAANEQERFLVRAVNPNYPDSAEEPHRLLGFFLAVIAALVLYAVGTLIIHTVRDFQGN
jgi:capsule polysaccharide export protein KpsE/RkpR